MTQGRATPYAESKSIKQEILAMSTHMNHPLQQSPANRKDANRGSNLAQQSTQRQSGLRSDLAGLIKPLSRSLVTRSVEPRCGVWHTLRRAAETLKTRIAFPIVRSIREDDVVAAAASFVAIAALVLVICLLLRLI